MFFAYHEANDLGSPKITTEHLLLGILREDDEIARRLGAHVTGDIRRELERGSPPNRESTTKPVDLPLSPDAQQALRLAIEEAEGTGQTTIDTPQLLEALLHIENCAAARFLRARNGQES